MIIDLSSNNGKIDFAQLSGVDEIFIRATLGYGDKDNMLEENANSADAHGFTISYYHFAYPHTVGDEAADAIKQANYFCDTIASLPKPKHLVIDLENFSKNADATLTQQQYALWLEAFLDTVEIKTGIKCIIYTYADYLNKHLPDHHQFGDYPLWIANYSAKENPALPKGWGNYFMWQYSEAGKLDGITGHVDLSKTS